MRRTLICPYDGCPPHAAACAPHATQERLLGEDGNPRRTKDSEDPFHMGLVLEWVYGTIVSTAEKARDSAKKALGALRLPCNEPGLAPLAFLLTAAWISMF